MGSTKRNEDRMNTKASVNQTRLELSSIWHHFQSTLFPWLQETLTVLAQKQMQLIEVLEMAKLETHLPYLGRVPGRPLKGREAIARPLLPKRLQPHYYRDAIRPTLL